jgi:hypothetical protein
MKGCTWDRTLSMFASGIFEPDIVLNTEVEYWMASDGLDNVWVTF